MSPKIPIIFYSSVSKLLFFFCLFTSFFYSLQTARVFGTPNVFHSEYCGFNSWGTGTNQVMCTFAIPQSGIIRHEVSLGQLSKPGNSDINFRLSSWLSPVPSTTTTIQIQNRGAATIKLGFFVILIKNQPSTKYIDFVSMYIPSTSTNITDSSNTVRYHALDTNINTNSILMGTNLNDLKIVPFITCYSLYLSTTIPNLAGSEVNFMFVFDHQIVSPNLLKMKVTIQPSITMQQFFGSMLLVNIQQIQAQKSAFLSNPTLTATDCNSQKYVIGDITAGKLGTANFQILFGGFGTSFNKKCLLGFEKISYTKLTQFSFELGKNTYNNYDKFSQVAPTLTGLIPEISTVFFCYGWGKECSDSSTYYDGTDLNCYTPSTCPLPVPGAPGAWTHANTCPWCQELICSSCSPANRLECYDCQPGSNSFLNPLTKKCECNTGYYFEYTMLSPVTWNGAIKSAHNCKINCTYHHAHCFACTIVNICDTCEDGYYRFETRQTVSPFSLISRSCQPCLPLCKVCTGNTACMTCFTGYEPINYNTQCVCNAVLAGLLNCNACTVNTTCTSCDSGYFISSATGLCEPCSNIHPECKTCSDQNTCSACSPGYATDPSAVTGKVVCSPCNKIVTYCDDCTHISNCLHCVAPYGLAAPLQCMQCELLKFPGCIECTINLAPCSKCNSTSFLLNGTCFFCHIYYNFCVSCQSNIALQTLECLQCQPGYYVGFNTTSGRNQCLPCPNAIKKCLQCTNSTFCTKCEFPNILGSTNQCTQCEFPFVNYNNGTCMKYAGCTSALETSLGTMKCLACNSSLNFVFQSSSNNCFCDYGYYETIAPEPTQKCKPVCGDGILITPDEQCDDKNLMDFDGCTRNCKQEPNFNCGTASPSKCILIRDFTKFQFVYAERIIAQNKGILHFSIEPNEPGLSSMNWSKMMTMKFAQGTINAESLLFSYSIDTGMVRLQFPYLQTIENTLIYYEIKFDPSMIKSSQNLFKDICKVKGANFPLIVENSFILEHFKYIELIALILSVLAIVQFYLGSYFGKMIGLETIQIFQFVCFARFLVITKKTTLLNAFHDLKYSSTGFSSPEVIYGAKQVSENKIISEEFSKIDIQKYFLFNINFWLIPIILVVMAYLVISIRKWFEWKALMKGKEPSAKYKYIMTRRSVQYIYDQCIFPQVMMIGMMVYFNNLLCFRYTDMKNENKITSLELQNIAFHTLSQYAISAVFSFEVISSLKEFFRPRSEQKHLLSLYQKYELDEQSPHKHNYHPLYIFLYQIYYLLLYMIMSLEIDIDLFNFPLEITIGIAFGYFFIICLWPPYFKTINIHNAFLKINQAVTLAVLGIYLVFNRIDSIDPITYAILVYIVLGLLTIVLLGGFIRVYLEHLYRKKLGFKISQIKNQLTLIQEQQIVQIMNKKDKKDRLLLNNRFTIKNQLSQLKKSYLANLGTSINNGKLTEDEETFFMNKIKQELQQKNHMNRDFWGNKTINEPLVEQAYKPPDMNNLIKDQPQIEGHQAIESDLNDQRKFLKKKKQKNSEQEKQALQKFKRKLRSQLIQIGQYNK